MSVLRSIPSIEQLRQRESIAALEITYGRSAVVEALRVEAAAVRQRIAAGEAIEDVASLIESDLPGRLQRTSEPSLRPVINATGVIVHTNLGRAPLGRRAAERVAALATGYCNLEYDVDAGARGKRDVHAERLLQAVTGAEAALVVNNNAAATLLVLAALAAGREVIISRGELVEIGGGFRVPDVMAQSGAVLREVGTTNRTRAADYAAALSERTALILRVHPSNFRIEGFTERPALSELVAIGARFGVAVAEDLGSGYLGVPDGVPALRDEPDVKATVRDGAAVVMFSGDKLLGGPQAGIIVGRSAEIGAIRRHPLMRALRVDKMTLAALEATLEEYARERAAEQVPVAAMIGATADAIGRRADAFAAALRMPALDVSVVDGYSTIGGGSAPGSSLPTRLVTFAHERLSPDAIDTLLRAQRPSIVTRTERRRVVIDLRTVAPEDDARLAELVRAALRHTP